MTRCVGLCLYKWSFKVMTWLIYMRNLWYTNYWADVFKLTAEI